MHLFFTCAEHRFSHDVIHLIVFFLRGANKEKINSAIICCLSEKLYSINGLYDRNNIQRELEKLASIKSVTVVARLPVTDTILERKSLSSDDDQSFRMKIKRCILKHFRNAPLTKMFAPS